MNGFNSYDGYNSNNNDYTNNQAGYNSNSSNYTNNQPAYSGSNVGYTNNGYGYNQGSVGYSSDTAGYNQGSVGYSSDTAGYNQGSVGYSNDTAGYNQGSVGYSGDTAGYNQNYNGYTNAQNGYSNFQSGYSQGSLGYYPNQTNSLGIYNQKKKVKVSFNSPAVLWFAIVCLIVLVVQFATGDAATYYLFSVYRSSLLDPLTYVRFFGHALGHADLEHYMSNMMTLLIVGPLLEEKYGSKSIVMVMAVTALVTGVVNFIFCPEVMTLGASGIVFAFILLSSLTCMKEGEIPLTFILVAILYLGEQVLEAALVESDISNISHIVGGICGCILGYLLNKNKLSGGGDNGQSVNSASSSNNNFTYY